MTSPAGNSVRHIDVSDVIAADFRLPDGHTTAAAEGQGKVVIGNGSAVHQSRSRRPRSGEVGQHVDPALVEVADGPGSDDVVHAADMMRCDGRGCGRLDDRYSGCDDVGKSNFFTF